MVNIAVSLAGFVLIICGMLVGAYLTIMRRRGRVTLKSLSIKTNVITNLLFSLIITGILLVAA
jgi:hypothetical protein